MPTQAVSSRVPVLAAMGRLANGPDSVKPVIGVAAGVPVHIAIDQGFARIDNTQLTYCVVLRSHHFLTFPIRSDKPDPR